MSSSTQIQGDAPEVEASELSDPGLGPDLTGEVLLGRIVEILDGVEHPHRGDARLESGHIDRREPVGQRSVAELALGVGAPATRLAAFEHRAGVGVAQRDGGGRLLRERERLRIEKTAKAEAKRLERTISWVMQSAWRHARGELQGLPGDPFGPD